VSSIEVTSEVAGTVWKVLVAPGDSVAADAILVIVESMKMEIPLTAPAAGQVVAVMVEEGEAVSEDQVLVSLQASG
jgi:acetyl-CoA carboxylase biotin carboxyl carrier protein